MNILFLTLIHHIDKGTRSIFYDLMKKLTDEGHQVYICAPSERRYKQATHLVENNEMKVLKVKTLNIQKTNFIEKGVASILLEYQYLKGIKKYFGDVVFDMVLYSTPPINFSKVVSYVKKRDGATSYLLLKDIFPQNAVDMGLMKKNGLLHRYFRSVERELYKVSDHIGCMSPANVNYVLKHNPEIDSQKVEVNPNTLFPIDLSAKTEEKSGLRKKYNLPTKPILLLYGGNLGKPQGIDFLIEALDANKNKSEVFFLIIGAGTEYGKIENWIHVNKPKNVSLRSKIPKEEYDELIKSCDVGLIFLDKRFTIPNFPSRLLSYLECKMPVLAATDENTDMGQIIIDNGFGYWSKAGDIEGFNKQIDRLIEEKTDLRAIGEKGHEFLKKEYDVTRSYNRLIAKIRTESLVD